MATTSAIAAAPLLADDMYRPSVEGALYHTVAGTAADTVADTVAVADTGTGTGTGLNPSKKGTVPFLELGAVLVLAVDGSEHVADFLLGAVRLRGIDDAGHHIAIGSAGVGDGGQGSGHCGVIPLGLHFR